MVPGFSIPTEIENATFEDVLIFLKVPLAYILDVRVFKNQVSLSMFCKIYSDVYTTRPLMLCFVP